MKHNKYNLLVLVASCVVAIGLSAAKTPAQAASPQAIPSCASNYSIDVTMALGSRWEMCWERRSNEGLVLNQITYTPRANGSRTLILGSAALAQIYTAYDNNGPQNHFVTDVGLGQMMNVLNAAECPGGTLRQDDNGQSVLCQQVRARGYAWRGSSQVQGQSLFVFATSTTGNETYIQQWVFDDDGTIRPMLGVSGRLDLNQFSSAATGWAVGSGNTHYTTSRFHSAYWRLNFDLGGSGNDVLEQFDYSGTGNTRTQSVATVTSETSRAISPSAQRFWRIKDTQIKNSNNHNISYDIVPQHTSVQRGGQAFTSNDLYVTTAKACEQFASHNSTGSGCAAQVNDFVNGESLSDAVVWFGTSWHHVPRDEDEPAIGVQWQGLTLSPRDLVSTSPLR
jgi:primary-amine oxidase